jgi:hypothetical protein
MLRAKSPAALRPNGSVGSGSIAATLPSRDGQADEQRTDAERREIQDTMVVMARIGKTQSEHLRDLLQF